MVYIQLHSKRLTYMTRTLFFKWLPLKLRIYSSRIWTSLPKILTLVSCLFQRKFNNLNLCPQSQSFLRYSLFFNWFLLRYKLHKVHKSKSLKCTAWWILTYASPWPRSLSLGFLYPEYSLLLPSNSPSATVLSST